MPRRNVQTQVNTSKTAPAKRARYLAETPSRQSKRIKTSPHASGTPKTTPEKSQFFEHQSSITDIESEIDNEESGYEDEDASVSAVSTPPDSDVNEEEEVDDYSSEDARSKKRKARKKGSNAITTVVPKSGKGHELWRPGVKTDLAPGEAVFIKLPKAREPGKTPYVDTTIHPNTMLFLQDIKDNNDREWLKGKKSNFYEAQNLSTLRSPAFTVHDADYRQSQKDFNSFVDSLTENIIEKDETIPELPHKDLVMLP